MALLVQSSGAGRVLLLLGGSPSPSSAFVPLAKALSLDHRVHIVSAPGYDGSAADDRDLATLTPQLEETLDALGTRDVAVIGFSAGSYRSLALARSNRVRVHGLFLIAGFARVTPEMAEGFRQFSALARTLPTLLIDDLRAVARARFLSAAFVAQHPDATRDVENWLGACPPTTLADEFDAFAAASDLRRDASGVGVPVVARVGEIDVATPVSLSREIVEAIPHASLQIVPGAGHALLVEDFEPTLASVRAWAASVRWNGA